MKEDTILQSLNSTLDYAERFWYAKSAKIKATADKECAEWNSRKQSFDAFHQANQNLCAKLEVLVIGKTFPCRDASYKAFVQSFSIIGASSNNPRLGLLGTVTSTTNRNSFSAIWELSGDVIGRKKDAFNISIPL